MRHARSAIIATGAATGLLVGLRAVVRMTVAGPVALLSPPVLPRETLGLAWTDGMVLPAALEIQAFDSVLRVLVSLLLATVALATINAALQLAEATNARRNEFAVRAALGASPGRLVLERLRELRTLVLAGVSLGVVAGVCGGLALRSAWPGTASAPFEQLPLDTPGLLATVLLFLAGAHVGAALGLTSRHRLAAALRADGRSGWDPAAVFTRRALHGLQLTVAGTIVAAAWALLGVVDFERSATDGEMTVLTTALDESSTPKAAMEVLRSIPGLEAESLAAPGALHGLGIRDLVIAECGACSIGGLPSPLWYDRADHHAVAPGFLDLAGLSLLAGRDFRMSDDEPAPRVALVNEHFARTAFEGGAPLGKRIRIGRDFDRWYTVVGVVSDAEAPSLGQDGRQRSAVYLSALQHPLREAQLLLRGGDDAVRRADAALKRDGFSTGTPERLADFLHRRNAVAAWALGVARGLGVLGVLLAIYGVVATSTQTARRRTRDIAVRRAVGASSAAILSHMMGHTLRTAAGGLAGFLFFALLAAGLLEGATGASGPSVAGYLVIAACLLLLSMGASARATADALRVRPAELVR